MASRIKAVFDCNVLLQALSNPVGPAGRCVQAVLAGQVQLFADYELMDELADVIARPKTVRKLRILVARADELVHEIQVRAVFLTQVPVIFEYSRDPDDAHYVNLAIASGAYLVVSRDKDLLDLMNDNNVEGNRFATNTQL